MSIHREDDKWVEKYNSPEQRKKLLIEMMQEDEKNGMYDEPNIPHPHHSAPVVATLVDSRKVEKLEAQIADLEEQNADLKILLGSARAELERKEKTLEEYRRYVRW